MAKSAIGGLVPFSSVDWPGRLSAVVFIAGCPWRCHYCHNPHLQERRCLYDWAEIHDWLASRQGLLDAVVFSGGEALVEQQLPHWLDSVRALGFQTALHTAGIYPDRLADSLPALNWVGLDIKTDASGYDALTGRRDSHAPVQRCLSRLLDSEVPFECRTTWHPRWLSEDGLLALAQDLARQGVRHYAVQPARDPNPGQPTPVLSAQASAHLHTLFDTFTCRGPA